MLKGLRAVDLGTGMSAALATRLLADLGVETLRIEPLAGDPFYDIYPAYRFWHRGKEIRRGSAQDAMKVLQGADICIIGGESHPDLDWCFRAEDITNSSDRTVVLSLTAAPYGWPSERFASTEVLAQASAGVVFEHYSRRPSLFAFPLATYGAALHGLAGLLAAVRRQRLTGRGDVVMASLLQGALSWCGPLWLEAERPGNMRRTMVPKDPRQLIFRCADGMHVQLMMGVPGAIAKYYRILGITDATVSATDRGAPTGESDPANYFGNVALLEPNLARWDSRAFLEAAWAEGLPAELVLPPGGCWDDPQTMMNGIIRRAADGTDFVGTPIRIESRRSDTHATRSKSLAPAFSAPLHGVRVVDLGGFVAGPFASTILGDLGAEVIKIEPMTGDPMRQLFPQFAAANRGKRCIAVDAKTEKGAQIIARICKKADVVHHNFRPGVSKRLRVDAEALRIENPRIIVLETSAYGPYGPKSQQSGFDMAFQALCGHEFCGAGKGNAPFWYRFSIVDYGSGVLGAISILAALLIRDQDNSGVAASVSLLDSGLFLLSEVIRRPDGQIDGAPSLDENQLAFNPAESLYEAKDGWVAISVRGASMGRRLALTLGLIDELKEPVHHWGEVEAQCLRTRIAQTPVAELLRALRSADVWAVRCATGIDQVFHRATNRESGLVITSVDPVLGKLQQLGRAIDLKESVFPDDRGYTAQRGEHTRKILCEAGYSDSDIEDLYHERIVA
jgi:crotonobetainyl-CoA:carnitine CoA-transferase CaiB-like acyl-CoA transferase